MKAQRARFVFVTMAACACMLVAGVAHAASTEQVPDSPLGLLFMIGTRYGFPVAALCAVLWYHSRVIEKKDAKIESLQQENAKVIKELFEAQIHQAQEHQEKYAELQGKSLEVFMQVDKTLAVLAGNLETRKR